MDRRTRFTRDLVLALASLTSSPLTGTATAQLWGPSSKYEDSGLRPAVALQNPLVVEVHQATDNVGPLWTRVGRLQGDRRINWGNSSVYENSGYRPALAGSGRTVVEVHQAQRGAGPLWYRVGQLDDQSVRWADSFKYEGSGINPAVAVVDTTVVEVHQARDGVGPLWYRVGQVKGTRIEWGDSFEYEDSGLFPAVAAYGFTTGVDVVQVHQAREGVSPLWYRRGQVRGSAIRWGDSFQYDNGSKPALVSIAAEVLEVHQGGDRLSPLWYRAGLLSDRNQVRWNDSFRYDDGGVAPAVAAANDRSGWVAVEVHQGQEGVGALWYRVASRQIPR